MQEINICQVVRVLKRAYNMYQKNWNVTKHYLYFHICFFYIFNSALPEALCIPEK